MSDRQSTIFPIARTLLRSSGIIIFLILWEVSSRLRWIDPYFLPPLSTVTSEIWRLIKDGSLIRNLAISSARGIGGLSIACLVGLPLGFSFGRWFPATAEALDPLLRIMSQINPFLVLLASLVAVEMINATTGLGWFEHNSAMNFEIPGMYAGASIIVVLGFLLNRFLIALEHSLFAWRSPVYFILGSVYSSHKRPLWRPNRLSTAGAALMILLLLICGSFEIHRSNAERAKFLVGDENDNHAHHLGSEVGK